MKHSSRVLPLFTVALTALALSACSKNDDRSVGQKVDAGIAKVESKAAELKAEAGREGAQAKQATTEAVQDAKQATGNAVAKVGASLSDAALLASVKTRLALDSNVHAGQIDVDAAHGRIVLRGTAPDAESVARAGQIAAAIEGVTGVDNQITVKSKS